MEPQNELTRREVEDLKELLYETGYAIRRFRKPSTISEIDFITKQREYLRSILQPECKKAISVTPYPAVPRDIANYPFRILSCDSKFPAREPEVNLFAVRDEVANILRHSEHEQFSIVQINLLEMPHDDFGQMLERDYSYFELTHAYQRRILGVLSKSPDIKNVNVTLLEANDVVAPKGGRAYFEVTFETTT